MKIYIAVTNDLVTDNRVHKVATTLEKSGADITLLGRIRYKNSPGLNRSYKTKRFRLLFKKGPCFYAAYNLRLFLFLLFHHFDIIVSNDLDTLLGTYLASRIKSKKLVYDSHEYFTEVPELINRNFPKKVWTCIEKKILPKLKYTYTVSESIANAYHDLYGINMKVVRNVPYYIDENSIQHKSDIKKTILYQGSLNMGRGLEHLIDAMEYIDIANLKIIGSGDISEELKQRVKSKSLESKVNIIDRIPFDELIHETQKADLGIALEQNMGLNYYYALPNKLFDYIQARVPVLVSPFPEMKKLIDKYEIGTTYEHTNPKALAKEITELLDSDLYLKWKKNTNKAAKELCWENEENVLIEIFSDLGLTF